ncbi:helix-turn-helix transcriptional regulator [Kribbella sp. CA-293567]|uniref:helix-turn-helix transcriptional regulator n=1 Tax=Kribbella sp. CA-293567 TaxID=3002436 RepID=UPI0022DD8A8B|nr:AAA family ATPase [Kribbella sp. CA-293567]WBQ07198.1 AAA family ATPase [Kribbella sp. CA-293567]
MEPLRGRSAELGQLLAAMRAAEAGTASLTVVTGEPGIGKSALVRALVEQAERHGLLVAQAAAHQTDEISPLASLAPALRSGSDPLISTEHFLELAALNGQPLWLGERLADLIGRRLDGVPALIVLDDAQWADPLTNFVLRVVIARLSQAKVMWVLATRPAPGAMPDQVVDSVQGQLPIHPIHLAPLSTEAVLELAADRLGTPIDPALSVRLSGVQGVPFLAEQLVAGLYVADLPDGLVEGVRRRVSSTSELCQALLRTAAVFGSEFQLEDVAALMGEPIAKLAGPLDEAIRSGLLADGSATLSFRHELLRTAVLAEVPPSAQRALHRAIADQLLAGGRGPSAAAPHILATAATGDVAAINTLRAAAKDLLATMSITALSVIQQTFELTLVDDEFRAEVGEDVVAILLVARQFQQAEAFADDLLGGTALYRGPVPPDLRASIVLRLLPHRWATGRLESAELDIPGTSNPLAERLRAHRVLAHREEPFESTDPVATGVQHLAAAERAQQSGRYAEARDLYRQARSAAGDEVGSHPATHIEIAELFCQAQADDLTGALGRLKELLGTSDSWLAPQLSVLRARLELAIGNLPAAAEAANSCIRWSAEVFDSSAEPTARQILALIALLKGRLTEAREQAPDDHIRALLAVADGDLTAATRLLDTPLDYPERHDLLIMAATSTTNPQTADQAAQLLTEQAEATPTVTFQAAAQLVEAHNLLRKATAATTTTGQSKAAGAATAGDSVGAATAGDSVGAAAAGDSVSAGAAGDTGGDSDSRTDAPAVVLATSDVVRNASADGSDTQVGAARAQLGAVVGMLNDSPRQLLVARADELFGRAELDSGDRATGVAALERALESLTRLGAAAPAARVQATLQAAGVRRRKWAAVQQRPESGWEALTPMERRVALLVAEGHTNRSAADQLVLSASTVGTHLRAAFGKLGVNSRVQLTRLVLERFASPPNA